MPAGRTGTGVEIRHGTIRIRFTVDGKRFSETLDLRATKDNLTQAHKIAAEIKAAVANGSFRYEACFPESRHAIGAGARTFGEYVERYQNACRKLSATQAQYRSAINLRRRLLGNNSLMRSHTHSDLSAKIVAHPWRSIENHNNFFKDDKNSTQPAGRHSCP